MKGTENFNDKITELEEEVLEIKSKISYLLSELTALKKGNQNPKNKKTK